MILCGQDNAQMKSQRFVWNEYHEELFLNCCLVLFLEEKTIIPSAIFEQMKLFLPYESNFTREHIASHLQYLKKDKTFRVFFDTNSINFPTVEL